jgi:hypothetical protein
MAESHLGAVCLLSKTPFILHKLFGAAAIGRTPVLAYHVGLCGRILEFPIPTIVPGLYARASTNDPQTLPTLRAFSALRTTGFISSLRFAIGWFNFAVETLGVTAIAAETGFTESVASGR